MTRLPQQDSASAREYAGQSLAELAWTVPRRERGEERHHVGKNGTTALLPRQSPAGEAWSRGKTPLPHRLFRRWREAMKKKMMAKHEQDDVDVHYGTIVMDLE